MSRIPDSDEDSHSRDVQQSYDRVAEEYARRIYGELEHKPFDRAMLDRFAELARPIGPVCDLGCGPGHVARYLSDRDLEVTGIDLSPGMVAVAQRLNPDIPFRQGTMLALGQKDASLGGIVAAYSIIHVPRDLLARAFAEIRRVLRPGGVLLVSFHLGDEDVHADDLWGTPVSMDFFFFDRGDFEKRLTAAGFEILESVERGPYPEVEVQTRRAYILARRS